MLNIFKECAFDCSLNAVDIKGNYKCFAFGKGAKGFSYYPKISDDIVYLNTNTNTKEVKKDIVLGAYYQGKVYLVDKEKKYFYLYSNQKKIKVNINPKEAKPIYIDKENNLVYKKDSIKIKNPIPIAEIKNNKLIKI